MANNAVTRSWGGIAAAAFFFASSAFAHQWRYMINEHVAPLQIATANQPMKGGVVTEIVEAIFANTDHTLEPRLAPAKRMAVLREQGEISHWLSYGSEQWTSDDAVLSDESLFVWQHVLVTEEALRISAIDDLRSLHILLVHGYDYPELEPYINQFHPSGISLNASYVTSPEHAIRMLAKGRGDAYVDIDLRATYHLRKQRVESDFVLNDLSAIIPAFPIYLLMDKAIPTPQQAWINQRVGTLKDNGTIDRIVAKYR